MRRLIESGAVRGDRFLQIGLRGYWPEPETLDWMAAQGMRSYEMTEVVTRGLDECLTEAFAIALDDCDAVFLSVDVDVVDPGSAPATGTPEPGGLSARQLLDAVRRIAMELPLCGVDVVELSPPFDHAEVTAYPEQSDRPRGAVRYGLAEGKGTGSRGAGSVRPRCSTGSPVALGGSSRARVTADDPRTSLGPTPWIVRVRIRRSVEDR